MEVRPASADDVPDVVRLLGQLGYETTTAFVGETIGRLRENALDAVFVAVGDERVVGVLSAHAHELFHMPGRLGRITALVVDEGARGAGVGWALVGRAEEFFREVGCIRMEVTSGLRRKDAHGFYAALGFTEIARHFVKPL